MGSLAQLNSKSYGLHMAIPRLNHGPKWQGWTFGWEHRPETWALEISRCRGWTSGWEVRPWKSKYLENSRVMHLWFQTQNFVPGSHLKTSPPEPRKSQNFVPGSHLKTSPPEPGKSQKVNLRQSYNIIQYVFTLISKPKEDTPKRVFGSLALYDFGNTLQLKHIKTIWDRLCSELRWLLKSWQIQCVYVPQKCDSDYMWRRIQVSQVQAERQKKSILQMCLLFHRRAAEIQRDLGSEIAGTFNITDFKFQQ